MNTRELLKAVSTIQGFLHLVWGLTSVGWVVQTLVGPQDIQVSGLGQQVGMVTMVPVLLVSGFLLLRYADAIAGFLSRYTADILIPLPDTWESRLYPSVLPIIGIVLVIYAIPGLVQEGIGLWAAMQRSVDRFPALMLAPVIASAIRLALGIYLIRGGAAFVRFSDISTSTQRSSDLPSL